MGNNLDDECLAEISHIRRLCILNIGDNVNITYVDLQQLRTNLIKLCCSVFTSYRMTQPTSMWWMIGVSLEWSGGKNRDGTNTWCQ